MPTYGPELPEQQGLQVGESHSGQSGMGLLSLSGPGGDSEYEGRNEVRKADFRRKALRLSWICRASLPTQLSPVVEGISGSGEVFLRGSMERGSAPVKNGLGPSSPPMNSHPVPHPYHISASSGDLDLRLGFGLCDGEQEFLDKRKQIVSKALQQVLGLSQAPDSGQV